jgi:hypothetical protein
LVRHIIYEEVISDLRISVYSFLMGLGYSLSEDPRVLSVEEQVDSGELTVLTIVVPHANKYSPLRVV